MGQTCTKKKKKTQRTIKTSTEDFIVQESNSGDGTEPEQTSNKNLELSERKEFRILSPNAGQLAGIFNLLEAKSIDARQPPLQVFVGTGTVPLEELAEKLQPKQFKGTETGQKQYESSCIRIKEINNVEEAETEIISLNLNNRKIDHSKWGIKEGVVKVECRKCGFNEAILTKLSTKTSAKSQRVIEKSECSKCGFKGDVSKTCQTDTLIPTGTPYNEHEDAQYEAKHCMLDPQPDEVSNRILNKMKELQYDPAQGCGCDDEEGWKSVCKCEGPETKAQSVSCSCALPSSKSSKQATDQASLKNVSDSGEPLKAGQKIACKCADSGDPSKESNKINKTACKCANSPQTCEQTNDVKKVMCQCEESRNTSEQLEQLPIVPNVSSKETIVTLEESEETTIHASELLKLSSEELIQPSVCEKPSPAPNTLTQVSSVSLPVPPEKFPSPKPSRSLSLQIKEPSELIPVPPEKPPSPKPRPPPDLLTQLPCDMPLRKRLKESSESLPAPPEIPQPPKPRPTNLLTQLPCDKPLRKRLKESSESLAVAPAKPSSSPPGPSLDLMTQVPCAQPLRKRLQKYSEDELITEITVDQDEIINESVKAPLPYNLEDPSKKIVNLLETKYNKKFSTVSELMQKPPKDVILFMTSGELPPSTQIRESAEFPVDYEDVLKSMRSGV